MYARYTFAHIQQRNLQPTLLACSLRAQLIICLLRIGHQIRCVSYLRQFCPLPPALPPSQWPTAIITQPSPIFILSTHKTNNSSCHVFSTWDSFKYCTFLRYNSFGSERTYAGRYTLHNWRLPSALSAALISSLILPIILICLITFIILINLTWT